MRPASISACSAEHMYCASVVGPDRPRPPTIRAMAGIIYCGDNLDVLTEYVPRESVDLIYLDPPFNSQRTYNLVYKDQRAQEEAFKDFWSWEEAAPAFARITEDAATPKPVRALLRALHETLIESDSDQLAYLTMMTPRLVALHRTLKPTGAMYLHCDTTASHYLKIILDAVFGTNNFKNDITWRRTVPKSDFRQGATNWPRVHDVILYYVKDEKRGRWKQPFAPYSDAALEKYSQRDLDGRRYQLTSLNAPGAGTRGHPKYDLMGVTRYWRYSREKMDALVEEGRIIQPSAGAVPRYKRYLDEMSGVPVGDTWDDIQPINSQAKERLPYPTQKPLELLKRIILASSEPGDLILDPFCGCGTTVEAAETLGRRWIGIDVARKAVEVIEERFEKVGFAAPEIVWHPADEASADALASRDKLGFERWVLRKIRAARLRKKDRGVDGEAHFKEPDGKVRHVIVSVKGGQHMPPTFARDLRGTIEREKAIGVLVSLVAPGKEIRLEAARAGFLVESDAEGPIPRMQLVTVARLFSELPSIRCPGVNVTEMPKPSVPAVGEQLPMVFAARAPKLKLRGTVTSTKPIKRSAKAKPYAEVELPGLQKVAESARPPKK